MLTNIPSPILHWLLYKPPHTGQLTCIFLADLEPHQIQTTLWGWLMKLTHSSERMIVEDYQSNQEVYLIYLIHIATYKFCIPYINNKKVLDYGCGTGYGTAMISNHCLEATGVDISPDNRPCKSIIYLSQFIILKNRKSGKCSSAISRSGIWYSFVISGDWAYPRHGCLPERNRSRSKTRRPNNYSYAWSLQQAFSISKTVEPVARKGVLAGTTL